MMTSSQIKQIADKNGMKTKVVIPNKFQEVEFLAVELKKFTTAFFKMNNQTFDYDYSHTYNAMTDKKTKRTPKKFNLNQ